MAYTRPTLSAFAAIFPAFANVDQTAFDYWIARAERVVTSEFGDDQLHVTQLLTAHYLAMQGLGSDTQSRRAGKFAGATRVKSGDLELGWADGGKGKSTGTSWGDEARAAILAVKGGIRITGTGSIPTEVNRGGA